MGSIWLFLVVKTNKDIVKHCSSSLLRSGLEATGTTPQRSPSQYDANFNTLTDDAPFGLIVHQDGVPLFVNQAWARIHGYSQAEVMAMPNVHRLRISDKLTDSYDLPPWIDGARSESYAYRAKHKKGDSIWLNVIDRPIDWSGRTATFSTIMGSGKEPDGMRPDREHHLYVQIAEQAEERFLTVIDQLSDGYALFDAEERLVACNQRYVELSPEIKKMYRSGVQFETLLRVRVGAGGVQEALGCEEAWIAERLAAFRTPNSEITFSSRAGSMLHVRNIRTAESGILLIMTDVTDQYQANQVKERFHEAIESLPDGYALFNDCEQLVMCNRHYKEMHEDVVQNFAPGVTFEHIIRCRVASGVIVDAFDREEEWVAERLENFRKPSFTADLERANGRWIQVRNRRTVDGGVLLMVNDVTDKKLMEQALATSQLRFQDFTELAADWFWEQDSDGRYTYLSDTVETLTNKPIKRLLGLDPTEVFGSQVLDEAAWRARWLALKNGNIKDRVEAEYDLRAADGTTYRIRSFVKAIKGVDGAVIGYRGAAKDITEAHRLSARLEYQANHDELTGLLNRRSFERSLSTALAASTKSRRQAVFCFIDLDQFKIVNDTAGHIAGDKMLQQVASLLRSKIHKGHILARLGGDEFGLLLHGCSLRRARLMAKNLIAILNRDRFFYSGKIFEIGASIGLAAITRQTDGISDLMAQADLACYAAKENGRNRVHAFQSTDVDLRRRRDEMSQASSIRLALDQGRFALFAQPIASLANQGTAIKHFEILLRMIDNSGGLVAPGAFIPAAERYGLMVEIDRWVLHQSCAKLKDNFCRQPDLQVNINLSGLTLDEDTLLDFVQDTLKTFSIAPHQLCFEITETAAIRQLKRTQVLMANLQGIGCKFALDDFGSGLSSFRYLKQLPVDYIKIDGTFICDLENDQRNRGMVAAIIQVGKILGIKTVAECAESEQILCTLRELGVDFAQGNAIGEPQHVTGVFKSIESSSWPECDVNADNAFGTG